VLFLRKKWNIPGSQSFLSSSSSFFSSSSSLLLLLLFFLVFISGGNFCFGFENILSSKFDLKTLLDSFMIGQNIF
jgi:hypothetical protein